MSEWELLRRIAAEVPRAGDDCAVIPFRGTNLLLTIDVLHRSADFPRGTDHYTMGWRAVAVTLSDVAAMGGRPLGVALALSAPDLEEPFEGILRGAEDCARAAGTELVGGDLDVSAELFLISSGLGEAERPVLRSGARPGDRLYLTGPLGRTYLALRLFSQGRHAEANELFRFSPRITEGRALVGVATAMIDLSDSLAHSLHLLSRASGIGLVVEAERVPLTEGLGPGELEEVFYFGEDYELLFTAPEGALPPGPWIEIGEVVEEAGVWCRGRGRLRRVPDRGWEHGGGRSVAGESDAFPDERRDR
ncbi:MAG: thiamine-phosphate kinase [Caldiserica bacterium]|nr:thiamine-phosphate kinase [Caldisericota bacterium]